MDQPPASRPPRRPPPPVPPRTKPVEEGSRPPGRLRSALHAAYGRLARNAAPPSPSSQPTTDAPATPERFAPQDEEFFRAVLAVAGTQRIDDSNAFYEELYKTSLRKGPQPADAYVQRARELLPALLPSAAVLNDEAKIKYGEYPISSQQRGVSDLRVYLNVQPDFAIDVYAYVLELERRFRVPEQGGGGITWTKLGSYEVAATCRDVILIYLSSDTLDKVIDALLQYQKKGSQINHFVDEIAVMTRPLRGLRGVGCAEDLAPLMEDHEIIKFWDAQSSEWQEARVYPTKDSTDVNFSHSQWRAIFIVAALRIAREKGGGREADVGTFRTALTEVAAAAKLQPGAMHRRPVISKEFVTLTAPELFPLKKRV